MRAIAEVKSEVVDSIRFAVLFRLRISWENWSYAERRYNELLKPAGNRYELGGEAFECLVSRLA